MKKSLLLVSLISLFLIGCSSTPINDASKPAGPSSGVSSAVSDDDKDLDLASLRDPNNILSKRSIYFDYDKDCLLYTSPSPRDRTRSRMPSSA